MPSLPSLCLWYHIPIGSARLFWYPAYWLVWWSYFLCPVRRAYSFTLSFQEIRCLWFQSNWGGLVCILHVLCDECADGGYLYYCGLVLGLRCLNRCLSSPLPYRGHVFMFWVSPTGQVPGEGGMFMFGRSQGKRSCRRVPLCIGPCVCLTCGIVCGWVRGGVRVVGRGGGGVRRVCGGGGAVCSF